MFNSNTECLVCSKAITQSNIETFPEFNFILSLQNVPNLSDFDTGTNIPSTVYFNCYTVHDFHLTN